MHRLLKKKASYDNPRTNKRRISKGAIFKY